MRRVSVYFLCCHLLVGAACLYYGFNPTRALVWLSTVSTVSVGGKHKQAICDLQAPGKLVKFAR